MSFEFSNYNKQKLHTILNPNILFIYVNADFRAIVYISQTLCFHYISENFCIWKTDYTKMCLLILMSFYGAIEFGKILVIAKRAIFKGYFPRTFVIENINFQLRWQKKNKPMSGHQGIKNPWGAFTNFVLMNHLHQSNWAAVQQQG